MDDPFFYKRNSRKQTYKDKGISTIDLNPAMVQTPLLFIRVCIMTDMCLVSYPYSISPYKQWSELSLDTEANHLI